MPCGVLPPRLVQYCLQTRFKELHTTQHQRRYLITLINKGLGFAEKILQRELRNPKKHNKKPLTYVTTYNKNNLELFIEIMKNLELKNEDKIKEILDIKIIKSQRQPKHLQRILTSSTFGENTTQGVTKCNNKRCKICDIIIEGKSYTFKNPETKAKINKNLSCNSENIVYIIEYSECKEIYIGLTQAFNTRITLHRSNIKIEENRKLSVSKHLYQCSRGKFEIMPIYQTNDYTLLQIKEKNFIDKFKPKLIKT